MKIAVSACTRTRADGDLFFAMKMFHIFENTESGTSSMLTFRKRYALLALLLLLVEIYIALYVHDGIVRPYIGDFLVVMLIYCFGRAFFRVPVLKAALATLVFAYLVEFMQYLNLIKWLGLQDSRIVNVVLGNLFEWIDMLAYTLGVAVVLIIEKMSADIRSKRLRH